MIVKNARIHVFYSWFYGNKYYAYTWVLLRAKSTAPKNIQSMD